MGHNPNLDNDWGGVDWLTAHLEQWATAISLGRPIIAHDESGVLVELLTDGSADKPEPITSGTPEGNKPRSNCGPFHHLLGELVAETFAAEVRIVPNLSTWSPYCLEVRFKYARVPPRQSKSDGRTASSESADPPLVLPVSAAERFIYVRVNQDGSGVDNREVRSFRRALGGYLDPDRLDDPVVDLSGDSSVRDITWQTGTVPRSRCIYWNDECPSEDLRAQLLIALAQLAVIQVDERLTGELGRYLRKNFGTSIRWAVKRHRLTGKQVAERACAQILQNYSFPEHPHGFRLYVKRVLRWPPGAGEAEYQPDFDAGKESYTIPEAAHHLAVSRDTLYRLIRHEKLHAQPGDDELIRIPRAELLKVAAYRLERLRRKREREELQDQQAKSPEAARKAVYRSKGRLPSIGPSTKDTVR
jgi:excisionase family DNA binding protein